MASFSFSCAVLLVFYFFICRAIATDSSYQDSLMVDKHNEWMTRFQRVYANDDEKAKRYKIFKKNVEYIDSINRDGNRTFRLGLNEFADLTREEFLASHTGYVKPPTAQVTTTTFRYEGETDLPPSIDWRERGAVTKVKNQGYCGCCWAFSSVASVEGIHQINTGNLVSFSEQELIDCNTENNGCNGGILERAFEFIMENGLTAYENYPYLRDQYDCNRQALSYPNVRISGFEVVPRNNEYALRQAVAHQPVSISVDHSCFQFYSSGIFDLDCGRNTDHAMTIVGYGTDERTGIKYWLVKNSWGEYWGENGYMRMLRDIDDPRGFCALATNPCYPVW